jgi:26S proteasome regulatory subunit N8
MSIGDEGRDVEVQENTVAEPVFLPSASRVDVHPLVMLSLVDHYSRVNAKAVNKKRVAGLLLGNYQRRPGDVQVLDINNCFAVPFDEDKAIPDVWILDTNYAQEMFQMYKKVLPKVRIVGWYSSGPTICPNDLLIHLMVADRFCANPIYCVVNAEASERGVPVLAYTTTEGKEDSAVEFRNVPTNLGALEAEEIGIEHLLRDITDSTITSLSTRVGDRLLSLRRLKQLLASIEDYLNDVADAKLPISQDVLAVLQECLNLQPFLHQLKTSKEMTVAANDQALATFVASTGRCVMALYDVIHNRRRLARELEEAKKSDQEKSKQTSTEIDGSKAKK